MPTVYRLLLSSKNHLRLQQLEKKEQSKGHRVAASRGQRSSAAGRRYKVCISRLMFDISTKLVIVVLL